MASSQVSYDQLAQYAAGRLAPAEREMIEQALADNPEAAMFVERLKLVAEVVRLDAGNVPPPTTIESARSLFRERQARRPSGDWLSRLRRVAARLSFDSRPQVARAGLRGGGETYQMVFDSDLAEIDLEVAPSGESTSTKRRLRGQIAPHSEARVAAVAVCPPGSDVPVAVAEPDNHGHFDLLTEPGRYDVCIAVESALVVLPDVDIE